MATNPYDSPPVASSGHAAFIRRPVIKMWVRCALLLLAIGIIALATLNDISARVLNDFNRFYVPGSKNTAYDSSLWVALPVALVLVIVAAAGSCRVSHAKSCNDGVG